MNLQLQELFHLHICNCIIIRIIFTNTLECYYTKTVVNCLIVTNKINLSLYTLTNLGLQNFHSHYFH